VDTLTGISAVLGIQQALGALPGRERDGVAWLSASHRATVFGGRPPLDVMTSGTQDGLMAVRRFLDAARGGIYTEPVEVLERSFQPYLDEDLVVSCGDSGRADPGGFTSSMSKWRAATQHGSRPILQERSLGGVSASG
jgi:hypothetical protein